MSVRRLEREQWEEYFNRVSRVLEGMRAEVEVEGLDLGDQVEAEWLPLYGIVYDPKDDELEVAMENIDHLIPHPEAVYVDEHGTELHSVEIVDREGHRQIVRLRAPLALPEKA